MAACISSSLGHDQYSSNKFNEVCKLSHNNYFDFSSHEINSNNKRLKFSHDNADFFNTNKRDVVLEFSDNKLPCLKMVAASIYLPKENPTKPLGEDAHFIHELYQTIGVADGVGGWAKQGIDAGIYARELMKNSLIATDSKSKGQVNPKRVLQKAYRNTNSEGSSTACVITLNSEKNTICAANVGDSGFFLIREGKIIYKSPTQQRRFNCPYQLGNSKDNPNVAQEMELNVEKDDILIVGTDGMLDNINESEIEELVRRGINENSKAEELGSQIGNVALYNSFDRFADTPFSRAAEKERLRHKFMLLMILDDVWEALVLEKLGIPGYSKHNHRCKVILMTRFRGVCEAMEAQKIIEVGILCEEEAWILFRQKTGNSVDDPSLLHVAKDVAKECKGLPLVIITVARALKYKSKRSWEDALVQLQRATPRNIPGMLSYDQFESDEVSYINCVGRSAYLYASIQRFSNLRTLHLINLRLDDISIIGELVTLVILSIRDSQLEELPVEIGKLTNLILLEFWNEQGGLTRIPPGVLSRLVRLEELHMVGVEHCSYSTLIELESLSRLTALILTECSGDVIYSNLGHSSKLTRYYLKVGQQVHHYLNSSLVGNYNRIMDLEVTETTPLGDWIRPLLRKSKCVCSRGNGSKNVLTELQLDEFQSVRHLRLADCDSLTHLLKIQCQNNISFPKLKRLEVISCPRLQYIFCLSLAARSSTVVCPDDDEEEISSRRTHIGPEGNMVQVIKFPNLYYLDL
ncbi:hypothetical protein HAX54_001052 [Datura stramonium]|uniref:Protein phosphatase n=1 Tax=Datura stramonium TaxID=4076 RepID=A0ABS8T1W4_DATST|nr:hypothetical protein [Datura stramonium]